MWFDIRGAAGQEQSVAGIQQGWQIERGPERRHEHRHRVRAEGHGFNVFLADHVEDMLPVEPAVGRNSDDRQARHV
jgi:hypothetical protein